MNALPCKAKFPSRSPLKKKNQFSLSCYELIILLITHKNRLTSVTKGIKNVYSIVQAGAAWGNFIK